MMISRSSKGSTAFFRSAAAGSDFTPATETPPAAVPDGDVLAAVGKLPGGTVADLATLLNASAEAVAPVVAKLQQNGFVEEPGGGASTFALSEIGERALRYSKMAG